MQAMNSHSGMIKKIDRIEKECRIDRNFFLDVVANINKKFIEGEPTNEYDKITYKIYQV